MSTYCSVHARIEHMLLTCTAKILGNGEENMTGNRATESEAEGILRIYCTRPNFLIFRRNVE